VIVFGELWDAPMCEDATTAPTPIGQSCSWCQTTIQDGDRGVMMPCVLADGVAELLPWHRECMMRSTVGSPAHLAGHCATACGGDGTGTEATTPEEMRAEALESWRIITDGRISA
jgi:hypothetical protein